MLTIRKCLRSISNRKPFTAKQKEATVYLYGEIGGWFGADAGEWVKDFSQIDAETIHLRVDSAGGDVFSARAMKTAIMQHKAKVIAHVDGLAASAASFLIMGADEIEIVDGGFMMIHNAMSFIDLIGYFNAAELQTLIDGLGKELSLHSKINEAIAGDYAKKTGKSVENMLALMSDETWFTASEAVENKFADRVYSGNLVSGDYNLSIFSKVPAEIKSRATEAIKTVHERGPLDAGHSNSEAMPILSGGGKDAAHPKKKRLEELLTRAEIMAPSIQN